MPANDPLNLICTLTLTELRFGKEVKEIPEFNVAQHFSQKKTSWWLDHD